jgi:hypothetical protein
MLTSLTNRLADAFPGAQINSSEFLSPSTSNRSIPAAAQDAVREAFSGGLHQVLVTATVMGVLGLLFVVLMPRGKPAAMRDRAHGREPAPDAVAPDAEVFIVVEDEQEPDESSVRVGRRRAVPTHS